MIGSRNYRKALTDLHAMIGDRDRRIATLEDQVERLTDALRHERDRTRARMKKLAEDNDRRTASLQSAHDMYVNAYHTAREAVADLVAEWSNDAPAHERYGWWRYTSSASRDTIMALVVEMQAAQEAADAMAAQLADGNWAAADYVAQRWRGRK